MASLTKEEKEKMVWLHVEHINGRTKLVDQDGREVGGVIDFELIAEQKEADKREEQRRDAEKQKIQADAQQRIDVARRDAVDAAARADGVRRETDRIRQLAEQYTGTQSASVSTRKVIGMLAELYEASERDYLAASTEADGYYNAGLTCQNQYDSLRNKKAP